ncbi:hypothetical protein GCM10010177_00290 [Actinomadura citrea]|nr:hypothetical protein GCM10010177_00290 [Actinomadura citrea]
MPASAIAGRSEPCGTHSCEGVARSPESARTSWAAARLSVYWATLKAMRCGERARKIPQVITATAWRAAAMGSPAYSSAANENVVEVVAPLFSVLPGVMIGRSSPKMMKQPRIQNTGVPARASRSARVSPENAATPAATPSRMTTTK